MAEFFKAVIQREGFSALPSLYILNMNWSAVITTYNSSSVIDRALSSIFELPPEEQPTDVVVVDNLSTDNTMQVLEKWKDKTIQVRNTSNLGLAAANAIGAGEASGDSLFFLNPDVELIPGAVTELKSFQNTHSEAGLMGPSMIHSSGRIQSTARTWPSPSVVASRRTFLGNTALGMKLAHRHLNRFHSDKLPVMTHWLVGAALWVTPEGKRRAGLMSEKYFLYFEDVEWCWRMWKRGMEVWYVPEACIRHVCHRESAKGGKALRYHLRSMLRFYLTHPSVLLGIGPGGCS